MHASSERHLFQAWKLRKCMAQRSVVGAWSPSPRTASEICLNKGSPGTILSIDGILAGGHRKEPALHQGPSSRACWAHGASKGCFQCAGVPSNTTLFCFVARAYTLTGSMRTRQAAQMHMATF